MPRNRSLTLALVLASVLAGFAGFGGSRASAVQALDANGGHGAPEPPMLGIHWARGQAGNPHGGGPAPSPQLLFHGGTVLTSTEVQPIYWGARWQDSSFVGDKVSGLASFYGKVGGSAYVKTNTEYTGSNGQVGSGVSAADAIFDTSAAPARAPKTSDILAEVARQITNPVANGYYPVYVDTPRGHAGYCAWHSWGSINGVQVQFAFFFSLDGDPGCDPQDTWTTNSQGLAALANVSGHELSEALTDPRGAGWYDSSGAENADKCAWTFNQPVKLNGTTWKIQGNWSNAAYADNKAGYAKGGCIDGN